MSGQLDDRTDRKPITLICVWLGWTISPAAFAFVSRLVVSTPLFNERLLRCDAVEFFRSFHRSRSHPHMALTERYDKAIAFGPAFSLEEPRMMLLKALTTQKLPKIEGSSNPNFVASRLGSRD